MVAASQRNNVEKFLHYGGTVEDISQMLVNAAIREDAELGNGDFMEISGENIEDEEIPECRNDLVTTLIW